MSHLLFFLDMRSVNYMLAVILSSTVILGTMGNFERGLNVEDLDGFQEPLQVLVENSNKRLLKRQTGKITLAG